MLKTTLQNYERIVVELPAAYSKAHDQINPFACAAACDAVALLCEMGKLTKSELRNVLETTSATGGNVVGLVLDDSYYVTCGAQLAKWAKRLLWPIPRVRRWAEQRLLSSSVLN
jgi:Mrp family chromosome partitioning ATPase